MLHLITGTDREHVRTEVQKKIDAESKRGARIVRLTDGSSRGDLEESIRGGGLFADKKVVVLDGLWEVPELGDIVHAALERMQKSSDVFVLVEEKLNAADKKTIEKCGQSSEKYDLAKKAEPSFNIFSLANALKTGNKKDLWVNYQRALVVSAPEAIHGILFWGAKDMFIKAKTDRDAARARLLISHLTALPHEARRRGEELEYALERFVLSKM